MSAHIISFETRDGFYAGVTNRIAGELMEEALRCDKPNLLLSGGSTPGPIYEALSQTDLPWEKVTIGLVDERWVDEEDAGSNAALVKRTLLQDRASDAKFVPMKTGASNPGLGQDTVSAAYGEIVSECSLAVLGMGIDGHVCSWFPNAEGLDEAIDPSTKAPVQAINAKRTDVTGPYLERMTLTLSALAKCRTVLLLITGDAKLSVLETAMNSKTLDLPVSHLLKLGQDKLTIFHAP